MQLTHAFKKIIRISLRKLMQCSLPTANNTEVDKKMITA